jgi:hypothetical protein
LILAKRPRRYDQSPARGRTNRTGDWQPELWVSEGTEEGRSARVRMDPNFRSVLWWIHEAVIAASGVEREREREERESTPGGHTEDTHTHTHTHTHTERERERERERREKRERGHTHTDRE